MADCSSVKQDVLITPHEGASNVSDVCHICWTVVTNHNWRNIAITLIDPSTVARTTVVKL
ncbi:MAG: hypothetical protein WCB59_07925, partial [Candidatus Sulfotelmatobacter sp.]